MLHCKCNCCCFLLFTFFSFIQSPKRKSHLHVCTYGCSEMVVVFLTGSLFPCRHASSTRESCLKFKCKHYFPINLHPQTTAQLLILQLLTPPDHPRSRLQILAQHSCDLARLP